MHIGKPAIKGLPAQSVPELMGSHRAIRSLLHTQRSNKQLLLGESVADLFDLSGGCVQHGGNGPYRESLSGHTGGFQDALLLDIQLLNLDLQHLLQRLGNARIDVLKGPGKRPVSVILRDPALLNHLLHDSCYKQRVSAGVTVHQAGKIGWDAAIGKQVGQVLSDFALLQPLDGDFIA